MALYLKPAKILDELRLHMPVAITLEDPISRSPIVLSYENLHQLLVIDVENLVVDGQVVANLYAEMARFQRAAEYAADREEIRYTGWKNAIAKAARASAAAAAPAPDPEPEGDDGKKKRGSKSSAAPKITVAEAEAAYRTHPEYEARSLEPKRMRAIAGLFDDLKWGFRMKSEQMRDQQRTVGGYGATDRDGDFAAGVEGGPPARRSPEERIADYTSLAKEAARAAAESGSSAAMQELLSRTPKPDPTTPPPRRNPAPLE